MVRTGMAPSKQQTSPTTTSSSNSGVVPITSTTGGLGPLGGKAAGKQTVVVHNPSGPVYEPASGKVGSEKYYR